MNKKVRNRLFLIIGGVAIMIGLAGCGIKGKEEVEQGFESVLAMYPTKNIMDFYDMEGYRDEEFDKEDKGVWLLNSDMSINQTKESPLISEGMLLRLNRNTRKAKGYYYIRTIPQEVERPVLEEKFPITYDAQGFHLIEPTDQENKELREKLDNFQFFVQYVEFKHLDQYENLRKMYNPEVPMYELEYQLTNEDVNVKELRNRYDIPTETAPTLLLKGQGELSGDSVGYKTLEFTFDKNVNVYFTDSIDFQPVSWEDM